LSGKAKRKLDYAGWSTDIFDSDTKIDKLLDARGWIGFSVYFYLCQKAFGSDGYFYKWSYDDCASTARKMSCGISAETVHETVSYCLHIGLFHKGLFDRQGVLTSRGIQRSYWAVAKSRRDRTVYRELWLLESAECEGIIFVPQNEEMSATNDHSQATNEEMSATNDTVVKSSVVKGNVVKSSTCVTRFNEFFSAYPKQVNLLATEKEYVLALLNDQSLTEAALITAALNYADAVSILSTDQKYIKNPDRFLSEGRYIDYLEENYKKPKSDSKSSKNSFNNFSKNDYDFAALEKDLLGN
jgi:hypothetical protein